LAKTKKTDGKLGPKKPTARHRSGTAKKTEEQSAIRRGVALWCNLERSQKMEDWREVYKLGVKMNPRTVSACILGRFNDLISRAF